MRETMNMTKKEVWVFALMAVLSGFMIGIGGTASLLANYLLGVWGKLIGALLFSLGIYAIVTYGMKLFTGMVADIPKMGMKNMIICFQITPSRIQPPSFFFISAVRRARSFSKSITSARGI